MQLEVHHHQAMSDLVRSSKMDNVTFITDDFGNEHIIIDRGNGEFTSMLKSTYDEMIAAQANQPTL